MSARLVAIAVLAAVYALTLRSADPVDLLTGVVLAAAVTTLLPLTRRSLSGAPAGFLGRVAAFPGFAVAVIALAVGGTWDVALRVLGLRPADRGGIVPVPIGERSEVGIAVTALASTLSPGSLLVDIDRERGVMLMHAIDASDPDAVVAEHQRFYERHQRRVFP